jgi:hypothetical protein
MVMDVVLVAILGGVLWAIHQTSKYMEDNKDEKK